MKKPLLKLVQSNGYLSADDDTISGLLFDHLYPDRSESVCADDILFVKALASAHGWDVKVRNARKDELEDED